MSGEQWRRAFWVLVAFCLALMAIEFLLLGAVDIPFFIVVAGMAVIAAYSFYVKR